MCGRRLIFGRGAGFSARLASSISSHSFRFGSKSMGFLAIFLAPWRLWPRDLWLWPGSAIPTTATTSATASPVSRAGLFLLKFLLFKLMLMSGVVKLTSGDDSWGWLNHSFHWSALTALDYHYWSQPLPTVFAWWADKSPEWF